METKITQELIEQAKQAGSMEELLAFAKENGVELTAEDAQKIYELWHASAELSDKELDNVAGGCGPKKPDYCPHCGCKDIVKSYSLHYFECTGCGKGVGGLRRPR